MKINHYPVFNIEAVEQHYSSEDGTPCRYVCTSELSDSNHPVDIFYRDTPHPKFGNYYFGLYWNQEEGKPYICAADQIERELFGMICVNGEYEYSRYRHDYREFEDGQMIDGGRAYIRSSGDVEIFRLYQGNWHEEGKNVSSKTE